MDVKNYRQIAYWQLMERIFSQEDTKAFLPLSEQILEEVDLPKIVLQDNVSIPNLVQRYPKLKGKFDALLQPQKEARMVQLTIESTIEPDWSTETINREGVFFLAVCL